jgi:hypothetical protein
MPPCDLPSARFAKTWIGCHLSSAGAQVNQIETDLRFLDHSIQFIAQVDGGYAAIARRGAETQPSRKNPERLRAQFSGMFRYA